MIAANVRVYTDKLNTAPIHVFNALYMAMMHAYSRHTYPTNSPLFTAHLISPVTVFIVRHNTISMLVYDTCSHSLTSG